MRDAFRLFKRFLPPYKAYVSLGILSNIFAAIFSIFSYIALIPLLKILFQLDAKAYEYVDADISLIPFRIPRDAIMNNMYAWLGKSIETNGPIRVLLFVALLGVAMIFFKSVFTYMASFFMVKIRNHVVKDIRNNIVGKIISLPIGFFTEEKKGDIIARTTGDVTEIEVSIVSSFDALIKNPIIILITLFSMIFVSWQLTIFIFIMLPFAGAIIGFIGKTLRKRSFQGQNKMGEILSTVEETLGGLRIIKGFNAEKKIQRKQKVQNEEYRSIMDKLMLRYFLASPMSEFLGVLVVMSVMWYGGRLILTQTGENLLQPEEFLVYLGLFYNIINPTKAFSTGFYNVQKGLAAVDRIDRILNTKSNIIIKENPLPINKFEDKIEYKNVWFKYNEEYVLRDISITIQKGQTVALVGPSGSGKSTLADLLPRFYDVTKGNLLVDGNEVSDLDIKALRNLMGIVNQEPILFNDTIFNNIIFGVDQAGTEEVEMAAKIANAHEFIMETENGYQTNIGDRGTRLSGGQKQRISIARAVLKNPPIMILDEATSALDTESEKLVQQAINNLMKKRTSIVIAHRLSTIRNANNIYVLKQGKIVEQGNYKELLAKNGEFKTLHDNQFQ
ncbi:MAG: ABC transporter ATP-binding protein [Bacteroidales bacterium]|nr:ABC transporter ATP-binding protein [Bacteroidales bacterium]